MNLSFSFAAYAAGRRPRSSFNIPIPPPTHTHTHTATGTIDAPALTIVTGTLSEHDCCTLNFNFWSNNGLTNEK